MSSSEVKGSSGGATTRVYQNAAVHTVAVVASIAVGIVLTPVLLHTAGRSEYGLWVLSQVFSAASGYMAIFGLGLQAAIIRLIAQAPDDDGGATASSIVQLALRTYAGLGGIAAASLLVFGETLGPRVFRIPAGQAAAAHAVFAIVAVQGFVEYLSWAYIAALEGWQRYDIARTLEFVRLVVFGSVAIVLVRAGYGAVGLAMATFLGVLCRSTWAAAIVYRRLPARGGGRTPAHRPQLFRLAGSFSIINLAGVVYNLIDRTVISTMVGVQWLADYDVIAKVASAASIPANFLPSVIPATGAQLHARGESSALGQLFFRATRHSAYIGLFVASTLMLLAPQILTVWVGSEYLRLVLPLRIYLSLYLFASLVLVGHGLAMGFGPVTPLAWYGTLQTAVNVVVSVIMTRFLGFPGTLVGTVVSQAIMVPAYLGYFCKAFHVSLGAFARESLARPYALTAAYAVLAMVLIAPLPSEGLLELAGKAGACGVLFAILIWPLGLDQYERQQAVMLLTGAAKRARQMIIGRPA